MARLRCCRTGWRHGHPPNHRHLNPDRRVRTWIVLLFTDPLGSIIGLIDYPWDGPNTLPDALDCEGSRTRVLCCVKLREGGGDGRAELKHYLDEILSPPARETSESPPPGTPRVGDITPGQHASLPTVADGGATRRHLEDVRNMTGEGMSDDDLQRLYEVQGYIKPRGIGRDPQPASWTAYDPDADEEWDLPTIEQRFESTIQPTIQPTVQPTIEPAVVPTIEPNTQASATMTGDWLDENDDELEFLYSVWRNPLYTRTQQVGSEDELKNTQASATITGNGLDEDEDELDEDEDELDEDEDKLDEDEDELEFLYSVWKNPLHKPTQQVASEDELEYTQASATMTGDGLDEDEDELEYTQASATMTGDGLDEDEDELKYTQASATITGDGLDEDELEYLYTVWKNPLHKPTKQVRSEDELKHLHTVQKKPLKKRTKQVGSHDKASRTSPRKAIHSKHRSNNRQSPASNPTAERSQSVHVPQPPGLDPALQPPPLAMTDVQATAECVLDPALQPPTLAMTDVQATSERVANNAALPAHGSHASTGSQANGGSHASTGSQANGGSHASTAGQADGESHASTAGLDDGESPEREGPASTGRIQRFQGVYIPRPRNHGGSLHPSTVDMTAVQDAWGRTFWTRPGHGPRDSHAFYITCPKDGCFLMGFRGVRDVTKHLKEHHFMPAYGESMAESRPGWGKLFTFPVQEVKRHEYRGLLVGVQPWVCTKSTCDKRFKRYSRVRWHYSRVHDCRVEPLPRSFGNEIPVDLNSSGLRISFSQE